MPTNTYREAPHYQWASLIMKGVMDLGGNKTSILDISDSMVFYGLGIAPQRLECYTLGLQTVALSQEESGWLGTCT